MSVSQTHPSHEEYQEERRRKRDIRWDIVRKAGMAGHPERDYVIPSKGESDKRLTKDHLRGILEHLDVKPPLRRNHEGHMIHASLASHIRSVAKVCDIEVPKHGLSGQWDGFSKTNLLEIERTIEEYEPIGQPTEGEIIEYLMEEHEISASDARREASKLVDQPFGFELEDIDVTVFVQTRITRNPGERPYYKAGGVPYQ